MILVIGADGLIGGELCRFLKISGREVQGTSRRKGSEHLLFDLGAPEKFQAPRGVDVAVICAGIGAVAECARAPEQTSLLNVAGTVEIARHLASEGSRVIFLSSSLVFGGQAQFPFADAGPDPCCEYGRQKAALEGSLAGRQFACVRLTKVVETMRPRFSGWLGALRAGQKVAASSAMRFSPVSLDETTRALAALAADLNPVSSIFRVTRISLTTRRPLAWPNSAGCLSSVFNPTRSLEPSSSAPCRKPPLWPHLFPPTLLAGDSRRLRSLWIVLSALCEKAHADV